MDTHFKKVGVKWERNSKFDSTSKLELSLSLFKFALSRDFKFIIDIVNADGTIIT